MHLDHRLSAFPHWNSVIMPQRTQHSRHAMPAPGPYQVRRAQPRFIADVTYTSPSMVDDLGDAAPEHFSLSSNARYPRTRHDQGPWNTSNPGFFPDQITYATHPETTREPCTMNPADAVYSQAMLASYQAAAAPLNATPDLFAPMDIARAEQQQVFDEQDIAQDSMLSMGLDDYDTPLPQVSSPFNSCNTVFNHGLPSPNGSDCTLANGSSTNSYWTRHGVPVTPDLEMSREISPYDLEESKSYSRHR